MPAPRRAVTPRPVSYVCAVCEEATTELRHPGPAPAYCPTCRADPFVQRERLRARKAAQRRRQRQP